MYKPRFVTDAQVNELIDLWNLARTALVYKDHSRHSRMIWAADEFHKKYPNISCTAAYKDLDGALA